MSNSAHANRVCPYLGLLDDSDTSLAFPSVWNNCFRSHPCAVPSLRHQAEFCLAENHQQCGVFLDQQATLPRHLRTAGQKQRSQRGRGWILGIFGIIALLVGGLGWGLLKPGMILSAPSPTFTITPRPTATLTDTATATASLTATLTRTPSLTPTLGTVTATFTSTRTATLTRTATPTRTTTPTRTHTAPPSLTQVLSKHRLETPIGAGYKFLIHKVKVGENMNQYAATYNTSVEAILTVNHNLNTPLWVDTLVVIPIGLTDVADLPSFEPYQVTEAGQSVDALAAELGVSAADLRLYNDIAVGELLQTGDWLLVPHSRSVS